MNAQDLEALRTLTALGQTLLEGRLDFLDYLRILRTTLENSEPEKEMYK